MFRSELKSQGNLLGRSPLAWMLFAQGVAILPLFYYLPLWLPAIWLFTTLWRIQIYRGVWSFPGGLVKSVLGACCIAGLLVTFRWRMGVEPMVSFLLCGFSLKLLEVNKTKDIVLVVYVTFVAIAAQLLFSQSLLATAYALLSIVVLIAAHAVLFTKRECSILGSLRKSGLLVLQSLPLMVVLFLVMPRLGQLWTVPTQSPSAQTGFSNSMSPGSLSELIRSNKLAFRVTFESLDQDAATDAVIPPPKERYWRGLAFEYFDGRTWRQRRWQSRDMVGRLINSRTPRDWQLDVDAAGKSFEYSIILEPHSRRWLFAMMAPVWLDLPGDFSGGYHEDHLLVVDKPIHKRLQYKVRSLTSYSTDALGLSLKKRRQNVEIPEGINPRAANLVSTWLSDSEDPAAIVQAALRFYNENFTYTLNPPLLGADSIDEFLFMTQRGFCEHFAGSFVYLMRLAQIPARVVVGYQGGELNQVENYLMVRQSDAHAWAEVWLPEKGWTRVDPTAAVSPMRIEAGLHAAVDQQEVTIIEGVFNSSFVNKLVNHWDALGYQWHRAVLAYDRERQNSVFEKYLGGTDAWRIAILFLGACGGVIVLYMLSLLLTGTSKSVREEERLYNCFLKKLARKGYVRDKQTTPMTFVHAIELKTPILQAAAIRVTQLYCRIAYEGKTDELPLLKKTVKGFSL